MVLLLGLVARSAWPVPPRPLPVTAPSGTRQASEAAWRYYRRLLVDNYVAHGRHDVPYDGDAREFLTALAARRAGLPGALWSRAARAAKRLAAEPVDDPLLCAALGYLYYQRMDGRCVEWLRRAVAGFEVTGYPSAVQFEPAYQLADALADYPAHVHQDSLSSWPARAPHPPAALRAETARAASRGNAALLDAVAIPVADPLEMRCHWPRLAEAMALRPSDRWAVLRRIAGDARVDPFLCAMLHGREAMERGLGWTGGSELGALAWSALGRRVAWTEARRHFTRAWRLRPDLPDAAAMMVTIAGLLHATGPNAPRVWFDRALAAQFDDEETYRRMIHVLSSVDGRSRARLLAFGRECLATERYDTDIPSVYLTAVDRGATYGYRSVWREPDIQRDVDRLWAGALALPTDSARRRVLAVAIAAAKREGGDLETAWRVLDTCGRPADLRHVGSIVAMGPVEPVVGEILALGAPGADAARRAERHYATGNLAKALPLYRAALTGATEPLARQWLERRVAECEGRSPARWY